MNRYLVSTRALATAALAGISMLPLLVIVLHLIQRGHYDPLTQAVSELALGRDGWLLTVAFCAAGTGMLGFAALLRRIVGGFVAPVLVAISALLTYVSAAFQADGNGRTTLHGQIHQLAGIVSFLLVIVAGIVSSRRFRRDSRWHRFVLPTLAWVICAAGALFLPSVLGDAYFGVAQRIFITVWLSWPLAVAAYARHAASIANAVAPAPSIPRTAHV